jgi:phosphoglycerol transferase
MGNKERNGHISLLNVLRTDILVWLPLSCLIFFVASLVISGWPSGLVINIEYPFVYTGDGIGVLYTIKKVLEGWYFSSMRSGYPFGADFFDYPMSDSGSLLIIKILGRLFGSHVAALNIYFLLGFSVTFAFGYAVLRAFRLCRSFAAAGAVAFVFLPFHFFRLAQLFYTWYFVVPLFLYFGHRLFSGATLLTNEYRLWLSALAYFTVFGVLASFGAYYALFGVIVLLVSALAGTLAKRDNKIFLRGAIASIAVATGIVANAAPNLIHTIEYGSNPEVAQRTLAESEIYGLKLTQLLLPHSRHRSAKLRKVTQEYERHFPFNENRASSLGVVGSVGVLLSFASLLFTLAGRRVDKRVVFLGLIFLALFLVATIGGLSAIFALLVSPMIRGWNRISVFIGFTAIATFFILLESFLEKYFSNRCSSLTVLPCAVLISLFAIWDQTDPIYSPRTDAFRRQFLADREFVRKVESALPIGAAVYQLPYMAFPENGPLHHLNDYSLAIGFIHSESLRWSYAGMRGREGDYFYRHLTLEPIQRQVEVIRNLGFSGIYIDRKGYPDSGEAVERELQRLLGEGPTFVHLGNTLAFYKMTSTKPALEGKLTPREIMQIAGFYADKFGVRYQATLTDGIDFRYRALPSFVADISGLSIPEPWGRWSDARGDRSVKIELVDSLPTEFSIVLKAVGFGPNADQPLLVNVGGVSVSVILSRQMAEHRIKLRLPDHSARLIELIPPQPISPVQLNMNSDNRLLGIGIEQIRFEL